MPEGSRAFERHGAGRIPLVKTLRELLARVQALEDVVYNGPRDPPDPTT